MALDRIGRIVAMSAFFGLWIWLIGTDLIAWIVSGESVLSMNLVIELVFVVGMALVWALLYFPHRARLRRGRAHNMPVLSIRGNDEIRSYLDRSLQGTQMTAGSYRGRIGFGAVLELDPTGLILWTGWGRRAGSLPLDSIASVSATSRQEGYFTLPALELVSIDGYRARFVVTDIGSGLFYCTAPEVELAASSIMNLVRAPRLS